MSHDGTSSFVTPAYAVDHELLHLGGEGPLGWGNLGDWSNATCYGEAAQALALRVGSAARIDPGSSVLDAGCGWGEQLGLWVNALGATQVLGLDPVRDHVARAHRRMLELGLDRQVRVLQASAAHPPLSPLARFDAVVAVDAAYHFDTRADFLTRARTLLAPGGRVAWTDLVPPSLPGAPLTRALARGLAGAVDMPGPNLLGWADYQAEIDEAGLTLEQVNWLDRPVLRGFSRFAAQQLLKHAWRTPRPGWLKIGLSGLAAGVFERTGTVRYGLFVARPKSP